MYETVLSNLGIGQPISVSASNVHFLRGFEDEFARQLNEGEQDIMLSSVYFKSVAEDL